jgi:hypothetical protein
MIRGGGSNRATSSVKKPLGLPASAGHMEISSKSNRGLRRGQMFQNADGDSVNSALSSTGRGSPGSNSANWRSPVLLSKRSKR